VQESRRLDRLSQPCTARQYEVETSLDTVKQLLVWIIEAEKQDPAEMRHYVISKIDNRESSNSNSIILINYALHNRICEWNTRHRESRYHSSCTTNSTSCAEEGPSLSLFHSPISSANMELRDWDQLNSIHLTTYQIGDESVQNTI